MGLFTSCDPMMEFWDLYSYTGGNPVNLVDPDGLETLVEGKDDPEKGGTDKKNKVVFTKPTHVKGDPSEGSGSEGGDSEEGDASNTSSDEASRTSNSDSESESDNSNAKNQEHHSSNSESERRSDNDSKFGSVAKNRGTSTLTGGTFFYNEDFWTAVRNERLADKANLMMKFELGALGTIGLATGVAQFGPAVAGAAVKAWPIVTGAAATAYQYGEQAAYRGLSLYHRFHRQVNFAVDYVTGLVTPPYSPPSTAGGAAAAATGAVVDEVNKRR
ncbi:MAG: hypothetical protein GF398_15130 [Chitinivibrionales bacterium]|nr:hypothetical protein [Chitinivibrionales bacterium]